MGPRDTSRFEMQIATYAHCPSQARPPIDWLKQILLIIEYLMAIIKSLMEVLTPHFPFSSPHSGDFDSLQLQDRSVKNSTRRIVTELDLEYLLRILYWLFAVNLWVPRRWRDMSLSLKKILFTVVELVHGSEKLSLWCHWKEWCSECSGAAAWFDPKGPLCSNEDL